MVRSATEIASCRFETGVWRAFSCTVQPHESLEQVPVSECLARRIQLSHSERLVERGFQLLFIVLLHPDQHEVDVVRIECFLCCLYDRAVQPVAMCECGIRLNQQQREAG